MCRADQIQERALNGRDELVAIQIAPGYILRLQGNEEALGRVLHTGHVTGVTHRQRLELRQIEAGLDPQNRTVARRKSTQQCIRPAPCATGSTGQTVAILDTGHGAPDGVARTTRTDQRRIGLQDAAAIHSSQEQRRLLKEVGFVVDGIASAFDMNRNVPGQGLDIAGQGALGLAEAEPYTNHRVAFIGQFDVGVGDLEGGDVVVGIHRAQSEIVDQDVSAVGNLTAARVLAQLQRIDVELGVDAQPKIDSGVIDTGIAVGAQIDEGLASDIR